MKLTGEEELVLVRRGARRTHHRSAVVGKDELGSVLDAAPVEGEYEFGRQHAARIAVETGPREAHISASVLFEMRYTSTGGRRPLMPASAPAALNSRM